MHCSNLAHVDTTCVERDVKLRSLIKRKNLVANLEARRIMVSSTLRTARSSAFPGCSRLRRHRGSDPRRSGDDVLIANAQSSSQKHMLSHQPAMVGIFYYT